MLRAFRRRLDAEIDGRLIDARRQHANSRFARLGCKHRELVRVAHIERHGRCKEFLAEVRLQIGRMIADESIGRRVRFVEAVSGELVDEFEDVFRFFFLHVFGDGALDEARLLLRHFGLVFFTHRAAEHVGLTERVAAHHLRDLNDLLLVDDDAVGFLQNALEHVVQVIDGLLAVLAIDVGRNVVHRTRPIERDHGDDVFEAVGLQPLQAFAHARTFELEDASRIGLRQHVVRRLVVERQARQIDGDAAHLAYQLDGLFEHGQRFETEEVELHEARRLDHLPVVLRDRKMRFRIAIKRNQFFERPVADHHAGGVRRCVTIKAFELLRDFEKARDDRFAVALFLQLRFALDRLRQRDRIGRVVRHEFAEPIDLSIRHLQHAADVAQHGARLQLSVRNDLCDAIVAVFFLHIVDDAIALFLAEIDVEVGHRNTFRIEEALEQQPELQRIEIGDRQRIGDERTRARSAARPDRNAVGFRPLDEVGHDEEVARKLHLRDDVDFVDEPLFVILDRESRRRPVRRQAPRETVLRLRFEFGCFEPEVFNLAQTVVGFDEARQDRLATLGPRRAAHRDLDRVGERLGQVREQRHHLRFGLEIVLGTGAAAVVLDDVAAVGDAQQNVVCLVVTPLREIAFVRRNNRNAPRVSEFEKIGLDVGFLRQAVALHLDVEPITENLLEGFDALERKIVLAVAKG